MNIKLFALVIFLLFSVFMFGIAGPAFAQTNSVEALRSQIQALIKQITDLIRQLIQAQIASTQNQNLIQTTSPQIQAINNSNSEHATLTVNATGVTAYVSINNGAQFAYTSPLTLNNGDTYSVTATLNNSGSNSTSKCSGKVSGGGNYTCNVSMNQH